MPKTKINRKVERVPTAQKIHDLLLGARGADMVNLHFKDGRNVDGAIIFNEFKGTGRIINIKKEVSIDFNLGELKDVQF